MADARYKTVFTLYSYEKSPHQTGSAQRHPVVIVGAGPIGLALALDLGKKGTPVLVLDDHEGPGPGSKAICFSKRTLDISTRIGASKPMVDKGIVWRAGKVFHGNNKLFDFDLLSEEGHQNPAFVNLQQPCFEKCLVDEIRRAQRDGAAIELRGKNRVDNVVKYEDYSTVTISTPDGKYSLEADWLVACDGARSSVRNMLGLSFDGRVFEDNFLIADVKMKAGFPTERWFWFEPPFEGAGQSALLHKQPDDVWRIDFQLGWDIDRKKELDPKRIRERVDAMLSSQSGVIPDYQLEWTSIYTFQCRRMKTFRHGRIFFAGDCAHQVSPFGARGANSGIQDAENLAWKLDLVLKGLAPCLLLDSYGREREYGADENILNSTRATDFMTPKSEISRIFRDAVLTLAQKNEFARAMVNSGRLSVPCVYDNFPLFADDELDGPIVSCPGAPCPDAPVQDGFLLAQIGGDFTLLTLGADDVDLNECDGIPLRKVHIGKPGDALKARYLGDNIQAVYLIRPDQHVVARWQSVDTETVKNAVRTAIGRNNHVT